MNRQRERERERTRKKSKKNLKTLKCVRERDTHQAWHIKHYSSKHYTSSITHQALHIKHYTSSITHQELHIKHDTKTYRDTGISKNKDKSCP